MGAVGEWVLRPMRPDDVAAAERLETETFHVAAAWARRHDDPVLALRPAAAGTTWVACTTSLLRTDPGGCWVAEDDTGLVGIATSLTRELLWVLASCAVRPDHQGRGIGRHLLEAALSHGRGCLRGMISSTSDPQAARRYRLAGFSLHPQMAASGTIDRSAIPVVEHVRDAGLSDRDLMDSVDRRTRGSAHGTDHDLLAMVGHPLVSETSSASGYAYADGRGGVAALAATDRRTATRLLWAALAASPGEGAITHVTAANEWALDVALAAGLEIRTEGYLALRGMRPPAPYLHHGALL